MALDITDTDAYTAVKAFCALVVPAGTLILQGQQNGIAMPSTNFVLLTTIDSERIGTNTDGLVFVNGGFTASVSADYRYSIQADFYSPDAESWATSAELLWRDGIAWDSMPSNIKPLYSDKPRQLPIIGGEDQWIQRWTMTLVLDYRPTWTQPTDAATSLTVTPEPIEVYFDP